MKEFLSAKGVDFQAYNVAEEPEAMQELLRVSGRVAVPVITVGEEVVVGFDRGRLRGLLHLS